MNEAEADNDFRFNSRLSPKDNTEIRINGKTFDKTSLSEIKLPSSNKSTPSKSTPTKISKRSVLREALNNQSNSTEEELVNVLNEAFKDVTKKKKSIIEDIKKNEASEIKLVKEIKVKRKNFTDDERWRTTIRTKANIETIKKNFPTVSLLDYDDNTPLEKLLVILEEGRHQIRVRKNANKYKIILAFGFIFLEFFFTTTLNFKMDSFASSQLENIHVYEPILNELGEFSPSKITESWRPEMRILGIILFNIVIFFFAKMLSNMLGPSVTDIQKLISGFLIGKNSEDIDAGIEDNKDYNSIANLFKTFMNLKKSTQK